MPVITKDKIEVLFANKNGKIKVYKDPNSYNDVTKYIFGLNTTKEKTRYIGGYGINLTTINSYPDMTITDIIHILRYVHYKCRKLDIKNDRKLYHIIIGFKCDDFDANLAKIAGDNISFQLFLKGWQNLYGVHEDTDSIHIHLMFNSVNIKNFNKYSASKIDNDKFLENIQTIAYDTILNYS